MGRDLESSESKYRIEVIDKVFEILSAFTSDQRELSIAEIKQRTGQTHSSAYRIIANLTHLGILERDEATRKFRIGARLYSLGSLAILDVRRLARPYMEYLRVQFECTANLSIRDSTNLVLVEVVETEKPLRLVSSVGGREPLHCTAAGKCLLAFLPDAERSSVIEGMTLVGYTPSTLQTPLALEVELRQIRRAVIAFDRGEYQAHACCVAAPIFNQTGRVCAAISLTWTADRFAVTDLPTVVNKLWTCGHEISIALGYPEPYPLSDLSQMAVVRGALIQGSA